MDAGNLFPIDKEYCLDCNTEVADEGTNQYPAYCPVCWAKRQAATAPKTVIQVSEIAHNRAEATTMLAAMAQQDGYISGFVGADLTVYAYLQDQTGGKGRLPRGWKRVSAPCYTPAMAVQTAHLTRTGAGIVPSGSRVQILALYRTAAHGYRYHVQAGAGDLYLDELDLQPAAPPAPAPVAPVVAAPAVQAGFVHDSAPLVVAEAVLRAHWPHMSTGVGWHWGELSRADRMIITWVGALPAAYDTRFDLLAVMRQRLEDAGLRCFDLELYGKTCVGIWRGPGLI